MNWFGRLPRERRLNYPACCIWLKVKTGVLMTIHNNKAEAVLKTKPKQQTALKQDAGGTIG